MDYPKIFEEALKTSPTLAVVLGVAWYCFRQLAQEHKSHLASKDAEIERLVKEKNSLQEKFLKQRLSTGDNPSAGKRGGK